ncbi:glycosyl hydrolase family 28-related protein [Mycolicibacterium austroafricanum]|uniref:glycosyl hydrolase family 28-related protein n=1 Tax=Mycolicibacterium austroafricanum TaxID=39687 RepID=UPI001CA31923|nr:glycosyl hydrolase family 28-related protein [Mycolicibacterium austroafricanum]QZT63668.1 hypothetical protein JN085_04610 [Mycolicibacterium austroafricanum]
MRISRRTLLAGAGAAAAAAVVLPGGQQGRAVLDVRRFGARGDGVTDDARAIQTAVAALRPHSTLYFPTGSYRFARHRPAGDAAVVIAGLSDVAVEFGPGAELLMDNLDSTSGTGAGHGLLVHGPASRIALRNIRIRWAGNARRSFGDGIRVLGGPTVAAPPRGWPGPVTGVTLTDCVVQGCPQAGVIMMGVSDIAVSGLRVTGTRADGLHFNACRRARIQDYRAVDTGDDGLALVTYFSPDPAFDADSATFSFPALTDWSNTDFTVADVRVTGGKANGVRMAGAHRVAVTGLAVDGVRSGAAVMVDSAAPGADAGWNYVASRGVRLDDVAASHCDMGIHLLARPGESGDRRFTDFDVAVSDVTLDECDNWSVRAESLTDRQIRGLQVANCRISSSSTTGGNGGLGIGSARDISLADVSIRHTKSVRAFDTVNTGGLKVDRLSVNQP